MRGFTLNCTQQGCAEAAGSEGGSQPRTELPLPGRNQSSALPSAGVPLPALLSPLFFFLNVTVSSDFSCSYCSPKIWSCSAGITKTEIQSRIFAELWGSGTMGVLSFSAVLGVVPKPQEIPDVFGLARLAAGIGCYTNQPFAGCWGPS